MRLYGDVPPPVDPEHSRLLASLGGVAPEVAWGEYRAGERPSEAMPNAVSWSSLLRAQPGCPSRPCRSSHRWSRCPRPSRPTSHDPRRHMPGPTAYGSDGGDSEEAKGPARSAEALGRHRVVDADCFATRAGVKFASGTATTGRGARQARRMATTSRYSDGIASEGPGERSCVAASSARSSASWVRAPSSSFAKAVWTGP
jgi:hypothetical protein